CVFDPFKQDVRRRKIPCLPSCSILDPELDDALVSRQVVQRSAGRTKDAAFSYDVGELIGNGLHQVCWSGCPRTGANDLDGGVADVARMRDHHEEPVHEAESAAELSFNDP